MGLELQEALKYVNSLYESPSHPVGLELVSHNVFIFHLTTSPSHTVGLEQVIAIAARIAAKKSPSHTVGLEHVPLAIMDITHAMFPSHAVGLELFYALNTLKVINESPSHTVGLEQVSKGKFCAGLLVSIPHGGLRTYAGLYRYVIEESRHPTRWAWNVSRRIVKIIYQYAISPSHPVGSER